MVMNAIGFPSNKLADWTVVEDCVSLDRSASTGGFSEYTLSGTGFVEAAEAIDREIILDDVRFGRTHAFVRSITNTPWAWSATLNDPFYRLNIDRSIAPVYNVTVGDVVLHFFKNVTSETPKIYVANSRHKSNPFSNGYDNTITQFAHKKLSFAGGKGNLWAMLKSFLSAKDYQITWIYDTIVVFENHTILNRFQGYTKDYSIEFGVDEPFSSIECVYYDDQMTKRLSRGTAAYPSGVQQRTGDPVNPNELPVTILWPPFNYEDDITKQIAKGEVLSVEAGETKEFVLEADAIINSIYAQPVCKMPNDIYPGIVDTAGRISLNTSKYSVVGKDNKPITPAQWYAEGGDVRVELGDEPNQLKVIVTGMSNTRLAPFRLAESDGQTDYNTLQICGTGFVYEKKTLIFQTGYTPVTDPVKIESPFINTIDEAYEACMYGAQSAFGRRVSLDWTGANPLNEAYTDVKYQFGQPLPVASDVTEFTGSPLPQKATEKWAKGTTMKKIMDDLTAFVALKPVTDKPQVFGRLAGSCVVFDRFVWTITNVQYGPSGVQATCEPYTKVSDLAVLFDRPRVMDLETPKGVNLGQLSLKGYTHRAP